MNKLDNMEYHKSNRYPHMTAYERAAQFAPFAALDGYSDCVSEAGRLTGNKNYMNEADIENINLTLNLINDNIKTQPLIKINYFVHDKIKSGGINQEFIGNIKKIDLINKELIFTNKKIINIKDITHIEFM